MLLRSVQTTFGGYKHTCSSNQRKPNEQKVRMAAERRRKYSRNWNGVDRLRANTGNSLCGL